MDIDASKLKEIASKIFAILKDEYNIPTQKLTLNISVAKEYYDSIKENFPDRHPSDIVLAASERDWSVVILIDYRK